MLKHIDMFAEEMASFRDAKRFSEKKRMDGLKCLSTRYYNDMKIAYDIMIYANSPKEMMSRLIHSRTIDFYSSATPFRGSYEEMTSYVMGKSAEDIFNMRAEISVYIFTKLMYQEQLMEENKWLEASLNRFNFLEVLSKAIICHL